MGSVLSAYSGAARSAINAHATRRRAIENSVISSWAASRPVDWNAPAHVFLHAHHEETRSMRVGQAFLPVSGFRYSGTVSCGTRRLKTGDRQECLSHWRAPYGLHLPNTRRTASR